jgi:hypothetical protein
MPDVAVQYFPAKSLTTFTLVQNVACTHDDLTLLVTNSIAATTEYSADDSKPAHRLRLKDLDNGFADASLGVELYGDGRLKGINASSTGQGQAVISAAAALASTLGPALGASGGAGPPRKLAACAVLKNWPDGKAALSFVKAIDLAAVSPSDRTRLNDDEAAVSDPALYDRLAGVLPEITLDISEKKSVPRPAIAGAAGAGDTVEVTLHDTSNLRVDFYARDRIGFGNHWLGAKAFTIPGPGDYVLPIPKAALFGGSQFSLTLSESGAVTALSYGKSTGAPAAAGAAQSAASVITPPAVTQ